MELQALRYAAMVSSMTFQQAGQTLSRIGSSVDAEGHLLEFLGWVTPCEESFAQDVRIVSVSSDFSRELTTSVIWLNQRNLDLRCVRLRT